SARISPCETGCNTPMKSILTRPIISSAPSSSSMEVCSMTDKIDVLDHGFVRLVESKGGDISIVRAARVSYDAEWRAGENEGSDARLIRYLWKNAHTSPF